MDSASSPPGTPAYSSGESTMAKKSHDPKQLEELLLQALQTEIGGIEVYSAALQCAIDNDLRQEWEDYLEQTRNHHTILLNVFKELGLDPEKTSPGREVVTHQGDSLVEAIAMAQANADANAAQLVAAECVVLAETKDHQNWELIGHVAQESSGSSLKVLKQAHDAVEQEEDHHLYHTKGWARELWIKTLGLPAVLPPPEEVKNVETAIGAARAEQARSQML
jgi:rubrerythrin